TFSCYASMMVISFIWGQKIYYIPYAWKKLVAYIVIAVVLFFIHKTFSYFIANELIESVFATVLLLAYAIFVLKIERKEFQKMPYIGKFIR
ncbi:hypothetical protein ABTK74_19600, partial [Acinetobacter baumannii]